jgi:phosphatidylserine decarboxylase
MATSFTTTTAPPSSAPVPITSTQPGGGPCVAIELGWGRFRRACLRLFRRGYVRRMAALRQGQCLNCPHDIIDPRDLKYYRNVCGHWFHEKDDAFRWRGRLGLARAGLVEVTLLSLLFVAVSAVCIVLGLLLSPWLVTPLAVIAPVWVFVVYFFRDPERTIPTDTDAVLSPADGTVREVAEVDAPHLPGGRALLVSIFLSVFNVHVNRVPRSGRVTEVRYFPGRFLDARRPECHLGNEQLWIDLEDTAGTPLQVKQIAGAIARRIVCWLRPGEDVRGGDRYGMIKFGSRTDLLLPVAAVAEIAVKVGDKVHGGSTVLLRLRHESNQP